MDGDSGAGPVAQAILAFSIVAALGLAFGSLGIRGIRLGAAGVLLPAFSLGSLGCNIDERILEFVRDFGLLLFVYTVGPQVGPGFLSSVKHRGLQLNAFGAAVVLLGGLIVAAGSAVLGWRVFKPGVAGGATLTTAMYAGVLLKWLWFALALYLAIARLKLDAVPLLIGIVVAQLGYWVGLIRLK